MRGRLSDFTGKRFGRLLVLERDMSVDKKKGAYWICKCDCGTIKSVSANSLRAGGTKSCGCLNREINSKPKDIKDMADKRFGKLVVIERAGTHVSPSGQKQPTWLCRCDCGNEVVVSSQSLKTGHTKSCGCLPKKKKGSGIIDLTNKRFGKLIVVERSEDYQYKSKGNIAKVPTWLCKCDCGNTVVAQGGNLRNGITTSCGCDRIYSKGEVAVSNFLDKNEIRYCQEYFFDDLRSKRGKHLRFDFAILDDSNNVIMLVEYQGEQHYSNRTSFGSYQRDYSDKMKQEYCSLHKIPLYEIKFDDDLDKSLQVLLNNIHLLLS